MGSLEESNREDIEACGPLDYGLRSRFLHMVGNLPHIEPAKRRNLGLDRTIEAEIIPRLMLAHQRKLDARAGFQQAGLPITSEELERFSQMVCVGALDDARAFVDALNGPAVTLECIMLDLLAPTAKRLGEMWEDDDADFAAVTIGLCCLQQVLRDISGLSEINHGQGTEIYRTVLAPVPGEQHIFSILMVDEFFRRDGWDVWTMPAATRDELVDLVRREPFQMAGLSISCEALLDELTAVISKIRKNSLNPDLLIMVGGNLFNEHPHLVKKVGADATAADGRDAVLKARNLVQKALRI